MGRSVYPLFSKEDHRMRLDHRFCEVLPARALYEGGVRASCTSGSDRNVQFSAVSRGFAAHAAHHVAAPAARPVEFDSHPAVDVTRAPRGRKSPLVFSPERGFGRRAGGRRFAMCIHSLVGI